MPDLYIDTRLPYETHLIMRQKIDKISPIETDKKNEYKSKNYHKQ